MSALGQKRPLIELLHRNEKRIGTLKLRDAPAMLGGNAGSGSAR
jgi:hypothetical protein